MTGLELALLGGTIGKLVGTGTQSLSLKPGRYVYEIKITSANGKEYKAVEGSALERAGVSR